MSAQITTELAALLSKIHHQAFHPLSRRWSADEIISLAQNSRLILAKENIGFALISVVGDEAELLTIAITPRAQGNGAGHALLVKTINLAANDGAQKMFLEVAADNIPALRLYHKQGFAEAGRRKAYYQRLDKSRVDALVMSRVI
jgi:ribosomal-protein-alanine N-acetyltransferase